MLIGLIVLYDAWHKRNPVSPLLMGACRAMVYVVAGLAIAGELNAALWGAAAVLLIYLVGLTQVAKAESGGIAARWPVVAVLAPAVYWAKELPDAAVALLLVAFLVWAGYALWLVLAQHRIGAGRRAPDRRDRHLRRARRGRRAAAAPSRCRGLAVCLRRLRCAT